ncbi:hypothetical protein DFH27DRAFT_562650 [Peziza echinospora]|nr:hypothetical protein DFH27DRAFT_562650 [Peziza echinospora]
MWRTIRQRGAVLLLFSIWGCCWRGWGSVWTTVAMLSLLSSRYRGSFARRYARWSSGAWTSHSEGRSWGNHCWLCDNRGSGSWGSGSRSSYGLSSEDRSSDEWRGHKPWSEQR